MTRGTPVIVTIFALALIFALASASEADVVLEGVHAARCNEGGTLRLPRKMTFYQTIMTSDFENFESVSLILATALSSRPDLNTGKLVATVRQIKPDGTVIELGKLGRPYRAGQAMKEKVITARLENGDLVEWELKLKQLPPLETFLECWLVEMDIGSAQMLQ